MQTDTRIPQNLSVPLTLPDEKAHHIQAIASASRDWTLKSNDFLRTLIENSSDETRLEVLRAFVFRLYTKCLANGGAPRQMQVESLLPSGALATIDLRPVVENIDALGGLVKSLFSSKSAGRIEVLPCRIEDRAGSGLGLMLLVSANPMIVMGALDEGDGLFLRQIDPTSRSAVWPSATKDGRAIGRAVVVPLSSVFMHTHKTK